MTIISIVFGKKNSRDWIRLVIYTWIIQEVAYILSR